VVPATAQTRLLCLPEPRDPVRPLVRLNVGSPPFMRAPGESTWTFALESAMEEPAYALSLNPAALRLMNYAKRDLESGKLWPSSRCASIANAVFHATGKRIRDLPIRVDRVMA
jgi:xanthine dehydrogenase YagR molybdenum-binding subunit